MPKKTRRQKLHADTHRTQITAIQPNSSSSLYSLPSIVSSVAAFRASGPAQIRTSWSDYAAIRRDLARITIFTFLASLANGMLYFLTNK